MFKFLALLDSICAFFTAVGLDWFQLTFLLAQNLIIGFVQRGMLIFVFASVFEKRNFVLNSIYTNLLNLHQLA